MFAVLFNFVAECEVEAEDPESDRLSAVSWLSSSGSQIPAVSSRLTTTELPDAAVTRSERSLQGSPPKTEPLEGWLDCGAWDVLAEADCAIAKG